MLHGKDMQGLQDMCMQQCAGVIAPIAALVLLPSLAFLLSALLCTTLHLGFAQAVCECSRLCVGRLCTPGISDLTNSTLFQSFFSCLDSGQNSAA